MNILLAEDEILNSMLIERVLQKLGHTVSTVSNGELLLEVCYKQSFDLLIIDVSMPIIDGIKAIETIRNTQHANTNTAILLISANYPKNYNNIKATFKISDIVLKPFTVQDITEKIAGVV